YNTTFTKMLRLFYFYLLLLFVFVLVCPCRSRGLCSPTCHLLLLSAAAFVAGKVEAADARAAAAITARKEPPSRGVYHAVCFAVRRARDQAAAANRPAEASAGGLVLSPLSFRGITATRVCAVDVQPFKKVSFGSVSWCLSDSNPRTNDDRVCAGAVTALAEATTAAVADDIACSGDAAGAVTATASAFSVMAAGKEAAESAVCVSALTTTLSPTIHRHATRAVASGATAAAASLNFRRRRKPLHRVKTAGTALCASGAALSGGLTPLWFMAMLAACTAAGPLAVPPLPQDFRARRGRGVASLVVSFDVRAVASRAGKPRAPLFFARRLCRRVICTANEGGVLASCHMALRPLLRAAFAAAHPVVVGVAAAAIKTGYKSVAAAAVAKKEDRPLHLVCAGSAAATRKVKKRPVRSRVATKCLRQRLQVPWEEHKSRVSAARAAARAATAARLAHIVARPIKAVVRRSAGVAPPPAANKSSASVVVPAVAAAIAAAKTANAAAGKAAAAATAPLPAIPTGAAAFGLPATAVATTTTTTVPPVAGGVPLGAASSLVAPRAKLKFVPRVVPRAGSRPGGLPGSCPAAPAASNRFAAGPSVASCAGVVPAVSASVVPDVVVAAAAKLAEKANVSAWSPGGYTGSNAIPIIGTATKKSSSGCYSRPQTANTFQ
ncbi:hypothetical protein MBANPS3_012221, partial [Mucor bainieri]